MTAKPLRCLFPRAGDWVPDSEAGDDGGAGEDLRNFLLTSLQMHHLLVLAGSGTSLDAGGPSMQDLWNDCVAHDTGEVRRLLNYGTDDGDSNIEELLSRCDAYLEIFPSTAAVKEFRVSAVASILERCRNVGAVHESDLKIHKEFIRRLARRRSRDPRLRVFTTNYDRCFERAAGDLGIVALDGFSFSVPRRFDPAFFDYDIVRRAAPGLDGPQYVPGVFQYFKLHGSVDWESSSTGAVVINPAVSAESASLIYPTRQKYRSSFRQPHLELMAQFLASLRQPNTCLLIIGSGLADEHLSEPILSALEGNPHLRVVIVGPRVATDFVESVSGAWPRLRRLFHLGADVGFVQASFAELVTAIPDIRALTSGERIERAIADVIAKD